MGLDSDYLTAWISILERSPKSTTLKYALARALVELGYQSYLEKSEIKITKRQIANRFIQYYWAQEFKYRFRQTTNPLGIPNIIRILREIWSNQHDLPNKPEDDPSNLLLASNRVVKECFREVLPRFHNLQGGKVKVTFYISERGCVRIPLQAGLFFHSRERLLKQIVNYHWTLWLERINSAPRIASKVSMGLEVKRKPLVKYKKMLLPIQNSCFYCGSKFSESATIQVDHFIPWSYIFEDSMWNLILACSDCNLKKGDNLPSREYLLKLFNRNNQILKLSDHNLRVELERAIWSIPGYEQGVEVGIERLYWGAKSDGFPIWRN